MDVLQAVQERLSILKRVISECEEHLHNCPIGFLTTKKDHFGIRYYCRENTHVKNGIYINKNKTELIKALEEKLYFSEILKSAIKEKEKLENIEKSLQSIQVFDTVFFSIPKEKRHLIKPYQISTSNVSSYELRCWNKESAKKKFFNSNHVFISQNGEKVRSKSELIIADRLKQAGIPYHYESEIVLLADKEYQIFNPDFKILNLRTGKTFFWEHFGMMDDKDYCEFAEEKIEIFADNGFLLGKSLIVSFESSKHTLNTKYVDKMIKEFLI